MGHQSPAILSFSDYAAAAPLRSQWNGHDLRKGVTFAHRDELQPWPRDLKDTLSALRAVVCEGPPMLSKWKVLRRKSIKGILSAFGRGANVFDVCR